MVTVIGVSALSTLAMIVYPMIANWLSLSPQVAGVFLGATIHDVAQVVGSGYSVSDTAGNTAVIVKLFRVFLLLPVVLAIGWYFTTQGAKHGEAKVPLPIFAVVFLLLTLAAALVARSQLKISLNENQILYLFSTSAQVIAAIYGLTLTGFSFFLHLSVATFI